MEHIPIKEHLHENEQFIDNPDCREGVYMTIDFYKKVGYNPPWIGYYFQMELQLVAAGGFKGKPVNGKVEIAYGVFPQYQHNGIGAKVAAELVQLSLKTYPAVIITARTLAEENYSTRILRKNNFKFSGTVVNEEDGEVWEWEYQPRFI